MCDNEDSDTFASNSENPGSRQVTLINYGWLGAFVVLVSGIIIVYYRLSLYHTPSLVFTHLNNVALFAPGCGKRQDAHIRNFVLFRSMQLQIIRHSNVAVVSPVTSW